MEKRKIATKNYVIFTIVCVLSGSLVWYLATWYQTSQEYKLSTSTIGEIIPEVNMEEVPNYITDNGNTILYVASLKEAKDETFEKDLKKIVLKHELNDNIVVLDKDKITSSDFFEKLSDQYLTEELKQNQTDLTLIPNLYVFEDGKIVDVYHLSGNAYTYQKLEAFILAHQVVKE